MNKTEENLKRIRAYDAEQWRTIKGAHVLVGEDGTVKAGAGGKFNGQKFGQSGGSTQAIKNLASAASPESKNDSKKAWVKYDSKGKAVITPDVKKAVNEEFERNKKRFPNQDEAVKQTLKKYFDKAQAYLDKDMHDEYAYENAKARCLMKKIYGKEYATKDT